MTSLVLFILIFLAAGLTLLAANLVLGRLVRPDRPSAEKGEVYECGEQPIGDAWVQFDLRFYVVALLFVIFDVELAFFFPWAVVFGSAVRTADEAQPAAVRVEAATNLQPTGAPATGGATAGPGRGEATRVGRVRGHPGVLRRALGRVRVPVAARRPRMGAQRRRAGEGECECE